MQLISSRKIPFIDSDSVAPGQAHEALFRDNSGGFILYFADDAPPAARHERLVRLDLRGALLWLNEAPPEPESWRG